MLWACPCARSEGNLSLLLVKSIKYFYKRNIFFLQMINFIDLSDAQKSKGQLAATVFFQIVCKLQDTYLHIQIGIFYTLYTHSNRYSLQLGYNFKSAQFKLGIICSVVKPHANKPSENVLYQCLFGYVHVDIVVAATGALQNVVINPRLQSTTVYFRRELCLTVYCNVQCAHR